jgi:hypothetical protein
MDLHDILPIYGRGGEVIAWIHDNVIHDMCGRWVAFLDDGGVYSFRGQLLGDFADGWFRDPRGDGVAFILASDDNGPVKPVCEDAPIPPALDFPPTPPVPHNFPMPAMPTVDWSLSTWNEFVAGQAAASLY